MPDPAPYKAKLEAYTESKDPLVLQSDTPRIPAPTSGRGLSAIPPARFGVSRWLIFEPTLNPLGICPSSWPSLSRGDSAYGSCIVHFLNGRYPRLWHRAESVDLFDQYPQYFGNA